MTTEAPTTNIRWAVCKHILDLLRPHANLVDVQIDPGYPGDDAGPDCIWIDGLDGDLEIPVSNAGRKYRDDIFEIPFEIRVAGNGRTRDEVMERTTAISAAIEDILADDPGLDDFPGVIDAEITSEKATCGELRGTGFIGFAEVVVSVHSRLE